MSEQHDDDKRDEWEKIRDEQERYEMIFDTLKGLILISPLIVRIVIDLFG